MKTIKRVSTIQRHLKRHKDHNQTIGFIPTMGALHQGHLSLIKKSQSENDITVVSIFVNPTQFNQQEDLEKYPRTLEEDQKLIRAHCDYLFFPKVSQVYPKATSSQIDLNIEHLTESMEAPNRPGHFEGVVQVVHRLLDIVKPDRLYMGQKDFQQFSIVAYMIKELSLDVRLRVCPTIREEDGLAMSSRNLRLKKAHREKAHIIFDALSMVKKNLEKKSVSSLEKNALKMMEIPSFDAEYFEIVDGINLKRVKHPNQHELIVACTACWAGKVRLIDNMILKGEALLGMA